MLLPGFKALGLDPAQVKAIIVGHGHGDHFGGSAYMQEHFGAKIYISAADWTLMENPPPARGGRQGGPPTPLPKHDQVIVEGQPIVVGDLNVMPVAIPGHTPGSMGFIFPVKDNGRTHMAALFGGTVLTPGIISDEGLQTYLQSVARFKEATRKAKVDVEIQNHPLMDPIQVKLDRLRARTEGTAPSVRRRRGRLSVVPRRDVDLHRGQHRQAETELAAPATKFKGRAASQRGPSCFGLATVASSI